MFFGAWSAVACIWLATAALLDEVQPVNFIVPVIPGTLVAANLLTQRGAEKIAAMHAAADAAVPSTRPGASTTE